ncbi:MAG: polysaccharide deacetylase family protein [Syntrophaceae bacterium]|nr:polysaccharide deacetylase family protein [Syntrophaceae bacterium]
MSMILRLPILTFHALDDLPSVTSFSPELFRFGLSMLHEHGYRTMSLLEAVECLRMKKPFPEKSFVMTFDDGYETVYQVAFPILQNYGMCATIFLTVGKKGNQKMGERLPSLEGHSMLNWHEIREMKQVGMEFGAHTLTHPDLTRLPRDQMEEEVSESKKIIENILGVPVFCFAYPYGRYNEHVREFVQQHFTCASSDRLGFVTPHSTLYTLERVDAYYLRSDRLFRLMLTRWFSWYIWACSIPRWIRCKVKNNFELRRSHFG